MSQFGRNKKASPAFEVNELTPSMIGVTAVVATSGRSGPLRRALESLSEQSAQPIEVIGVDSSTDTGAHGLFQNGIRGLKSRLRWIKADSSGAAIQRKQGAALANQNVIWFFDDDIFFRSDCVARLWHGLNSDPEIGGINAMISNQRYQSPGTVSRLVFSLINGKSETSFAGKIIGPAVNLLPEDRDDLPEVVPVEWLNTTCTMYRREALPDPVFDPFFTGYSLMEDVALSLQVAAAGWKLANARTARIFHDSQPAEYKSDVRTRAAMELVNRHYVMTRILGRTRLIDYARLAGWELFQLAGCVTEPVARKSSLRHVCGKFDAMRRIFGHG
jgi:GT2 family glycosyltransferase